jgi:ribosome recycling factor
MEINKVSNIKELQANKRLNQPYNKKKHKKVENGLSFSDVLKSVSQGKKIKV